MGKSRDCPHVVLFGTTLSIENFKRLCLEGKTPVSMGKGGYSGFTSAREGKLCLGRTVLIREDEGNTISLSW